MTPTLSVVIASFNRPLDPLRQCLRALANQRVAGGLEIIVVRDWQAAEAAGKLELIRQFPGVHWLGAVDRTVPHLRRHGVATARGAVVAVIEDDCVVDGDWAAAVLRAHDGPHVAIGGAVEPDDYRSASDWAAYFCDYVRFMLPFPRRPSALLPGNNVSYKREVLVELLSMTERDGLQDVFLHDEWAKQGKSMLADPAIVVRNVHRWGAADFSVVPFHHARAFGGRRSRTWSTARRAVMAASTPVIPALTLARIARRVVASRRRFGAFTRAIPGIVVLCASWAAGECVGYAAGPGRSAAKWK